MAKACIHEWENPEIVGVNKKNGHQLWFGYNSWESLKKKGNSDAGVLSLSGSWYFHLAKGGEMHPKLFYTNGFDASDWPEIEVPGVWQLQGYGEVEPPTFLMTGYPEALDRHKIPKIQESKNAIGAYKKSFVYQEQWGNKIVYLHFAGVKSAFYVWINGSFVGFSKGSRTPAEFNITEFLKEGYNEIAVEVYRYSDGTYFEGQEPWHLSGIFRDVFIYCEPPIYIKDCFIKNTFEETYLDAVLKCEVTLKNSTQVTCPLKIKIYLNEKSGQTNESSIAEARVVCVAEKEHTYYIEMPIQKPKKWTAETPNLYEITFEILDAKDVTMQMKQVIYGFRVLEIKDAAIYLNGKKLFMKGINRHEFDSDYGYALSKMQIQEDLCLLKRMNVNAILTSHYPNDPYFYELCDSYGFYVVDEAEIMCQGSRKAGIPAGNEVWTQAAIDRLERMILRDRNHPCIIMWSLGNESGDGPGFMRMKQRLKELDSTRIVHYEGDSKLIISDVYGKRYGGLEFVKKSADRKEIKIGLVSGLMNALNTDDKGFKPEEYEHKPILFTAYAPSMGNSVGHLDQIFTQMKNSPNWCGGFIQDFADQSIRVVEGNNEKWLYGGDFGHEKHHGHFCGAGLLTGGREYKPAAYEVAYVYQEVTIIATGKPNQYAIRNNNTYRNTDYLALHYEVIEDGAIVENGDCEVPTIEAGEMVEIKVDVKTQLKDFAEYFVNFTWTLKKSTRWADTSFCVAKEQFLLKSPKISEAVEPTLDLETTYHKLVIKNQRGKIECIGSQFQLEINRKTGDINSLVYSGKSLLKQPISLNFWRVPTDNERGLGNLKPEIERFFVENSWKKEKMKLKVIKIKIIQETNKTWIKLLREVQNFDKPILSTYEIFLDGKIRIVHEGVPSKAMSRFGVQFGLDTSLNQITYYGKGPHENYQDRDASAQYGIYTAASDQLRVDYLRPQENGNRQDIRWLIIENENSQGLLIEPIVEEKLDFHIWNYSSEQLEKANHIHELVPENTLYVSLDGAQSGIGGDFLGEGVLLSEHSLPRNKRYRIGVTISKL